MTTVATKSKRRAAVRQAKHPNHRVPFDDFARIARKMRTSERQLRCVKDALAHLG